MRRRTRIARRAAALPALAAVAVLVAACGSGGDGDGAAAAAPVTVTVTATEVVTVTVAAAPEPAAVATADAGETATGDRPPSPEEAAAIVAAAAEVVLQCRSVAAGFVEEPEREALERALGTLAGVSATIDPDAPFATGGATDLAGTTTLADQVALVRRQLADGCAPDLTQRLG